MFDNSTANLYQHKIEQVIKPHIDPQGLISAVLQIAKFIYDTAQVVKANQHRCQTLAGRINKVAQTLAELQTLPDNKHFVEELKQLKILLEECKEFVLHFKDNTTSNFVKRYAKRFIKAGDDADNFTGLNRGLEERIAALHVSINIQQLFNREQDKADYIKDQAVLKEMLSAIGGDLTEILSTQEEMIAFQQKMYQLTLTSHNTQTQHFGILNAGLEQIIALLHQQHFKTPTMGEGAEPLLAKKQVSPQDVVFLQEIARGRVGIIHMGYWNGQTVTLKTVAPNDSAARAALMREMQVMSLLSAHPSIITWYRGCLAADYTVSVMEYMNKGSLDEVLKKESMPFTPRQAKQIALDIARGLDYLHQQNIVHCNVSSRNVLLNNNYQAKLSDFSVAKIAHPDVMPVGETPDAPAWQAPEVLSNKVYSKGSDIYSYGTLLWTLLRGSASTPSRSTEEVLSGVREHIPADIDAALSDLIIECWQADVAKRPQWSKVIRVLDAWVIKPDSEAFYDRARQCFAKKEFSQALELFRLAAQAGDTKSCTAVGNYYLRPQETGQVVSENKPQAYTWFLKGTETAKPHNRALYMVGVMLEKGDGVQPDFTQAQGWYKRAAQEGSVEAQKRCEALGLQFRT